MSWEWHDGATDQGMHVQIMESTGRALIFHQAYWKVPKKTQRLIAAARSYHDKAHALAMYVLQSPLYQSDPDARTAVDDVLEIYKRVESK